MTAQADERPEKRLWELVALFDRAPIKNSFGMSLSFDESGSAVFHMPYNPDFDHALGAIHGGVLATLLDNAGLFTAASLYDTWISTVEMQVRLLEPVFKTDVFSRGRIIRAGEKIVVAEMEATTGTGGLVAVGAGTFVVTSIPYGLSDQA